MTRVDCITKPGFSGTVRTVLPVAPATATVLLLIFPNLALLYVGSQSLQSFVLGCAGCALLLFIFQRVWLGLLLCLPWVVLAPLETYYVANFDKASDSHVIGIIVETNLEEVLAFLGSHAFLLGTALLLSAFGASLSLVVARRKGWMWDSKVRYCALVVCLIVLAIPWFGELAQHGDSGTTRTAGDDENVIGEDARIAALMDFSVSYPLGLIPRSVEFLRYRQMLSTLHERLANFKFNAHSHGQTGEKQIFVLVIGETGRPDRWQLNGYHRATTPKLAAMENVISFMDMVSPWSWTRMSVPVILTRKPATERRPFFGEPSLISAFREAGFKTYWLSTQSPLGRHDSSIALHAHEANDVRYLNPVDYSKKGVFDGSLLGPMSEILRREESRQLIVLHTLGSHYNYSHRHPLEFEKFSPSLQNVPLPPIQDRSLRGEMSNSYDNSVLYTDYFLSQVIDRLKATQRQAMMFYVADHGENIFDGQCGLSGHGHDTERDFRVASLAWYSDSYASRFPGKINHAFRLKNSPLMTDMVFHSMLDAADITYPAENLSKSVFSERWTSERRVLSSGIDFDHSSREPLCQTVISGAGR